MTVRFKLPIISAAFFGIVLGLASLGTSSMNIRPSGGAKPRSVAAAGL
jgi:hypothetical protein